VRAIVEDDGVGFREAAAIRGGANDRLGLVGMRERAALVGGELQIESRPGRGTTLFVKVPLRGEQASHEKASIVAGR
jgi:signal transduction histidine kinase